MITFYYHPSPNPAKVALLLEETGLAYQMVPVDTRKGDQHKSGYLAINPNGKTPAIVDGDIRVFDSSAILLYLAEKSGQFSADNTPEQRAGMLSWLMFIASGIGPYTGQYVHFNHFAPEPDAYAINRYQFEAWRHWNIIEQQLARQPYMLGERYTLVDMAVWGWARVLPFALGDSAFEKLPNVKRLLDSINARPAAQRAEALKTQHPFKAEMDDEARKAMFPQNARLKG
jgi:GSH-dependent disulfide-bond oxidoreductase